MNDTRPNLLLFLTDDQRFDTLGALGNPWVQTPHLDALVRRGLTFTHAHIPGGTCGAVCMPSRAMLHTGRTLFHLDREGQTLPAAHVTLGEHLRSAGYSCFGTGKWHNGREAFARSFSCGDEIFFGGMEDHWNVPAYRYDPSGAYATRSPRIQDPLHSNAVTYRHCDHIAAGRHSTDLFVDAAIRFLETDASDSPFFLNVSLMAPHDPRSMPEAFRTMYDPSDLPLPDNFLPEHTIDTGALRIRDEVLAAFPRDPEEIRRHLAEYYAMITHLDHAFGRLMEALEAAGQLDRTIIAFAGDNGLAVGQHGLMGKQCLYDHSVRVPLVLAGPGVPAERQSAALATLSDLYPTLCDLLALETPNSVEGVSLRPSFADPAATPRPALLLAYAGSQRGVTDGRHKLIEYACGATQLFDLLEDPLERVNLAAQASAAPLLQALRGRLLTLSAAADDRLHPTGQAFWSSRPDLRAN